jgi:ribonuclease D
LLNLVAEAQNEPPEQWPVRTHHIPLTSGQEALVEVMMAIVRLWGSEAGLNPSTIASRRDLERLVARETDIPLLRGWRNAFLGHELAALLRGRLCLTMEREKPCFVARNKCSENDQAMMSARRNEPLSS